MEQKQAKSFAVEVITDETGRFCGNDVRFATQAEAEAYGRDLAVRLPFVKHFRVVRTNDSVNFEFKNGELFPVI
jgi:hypothetical protein